MGRSPKVALPPLQGLSPQEGTAAPIKPRYDTMLNWLIENPLSSNRDMAAYFGVTPAWMRAITSSDAFRAKLVERQDQVFNTIILDLREKIHGAAHEAIDRLCEKIDTIDDPRLLLDAVDRLFDRLGYTGKANMGSPANYIAQQNTINVVGADQIHAAREIMNKALTLQEPIDTASPPPSEVKDGTGAIGGVDITPPDAQS